MWSITGWHLRDGLHTLHCLWDAITGRGMEERRDTVTVEEDKVGEKIG